MCFYAQFPQYNTINWKVVWMLFSDFWSMKPPLKVCLTEMSQDFKFLSLIMRVPSQVNEVQFQDFCSKNNILYWFSHHAQQKFLYHAERLSTDPDYCYRITYSIAEDNGSRDPHEEADYRILYIVQQLFLTTMAKYRKHNYSRYYQVQTYLLCFTN